MFFSIIIPCYNIADYVGECLDSVFSQDFNDFEVIAVDDGSTDEKTPGILDEYAKNDKRVNVIHKENGNVASARNAGLDAAKGEYLIFLDGDDWLAESYLILAHKRIQNERIDILISSNYVALNDKMSECKMPEVPTVDFSDNRYEKLAALIRENESIRFGLARNAFRTKFVAKENLRFNLNVGIADDCVFIMDSLAVAKKALVAADIHSYIYRAKRNGSLTNSKQEPDAKVLYNNLILCVEWFDFYAKMKEEKPDNVSINFLLGQQADGYVHGSIGIGAFEKKEAKKMAQDVMKRADIFEYAQRKIYRFTVKMYKSFGILPVTKLMNFSPIKLTLKKIKETLS